MTRTPDLHAAALAAVDAQSRGLGGNDEFRRQGLLLEDVVPAQAVAVFLHDRADHPDLQPVQQTQLLHDLARVDHAGHARFLVHGAAAVDPAAGELPPEGIAFPLFDVADVDGVHVGVEGDLAGAVAEAAQYVAQGVELHLVEAHGLHLLGDAPDHGFLASGQALDRHDVPQEGHQRSGQLLGAGHDPPAQVVGAVVVVVPAGHDCHPMLRHMRVAVLCRRWASTGGASPVR